MKSALFLLLLVLLAAGVWFAAPGFDAGKYLTDAKREQVIELIERILNKVSERVPNTLIERKAAEMLGTCRAMTPPPPFGSANPFADMTVLPDVRFPFAQPVDISKIALLCGFPGHGKSVLIVSPRGATSVAIQRSSENAAALSIESGGVALLSDKLELDLLVPGMRIKLRSEKAVNVMIQKMGLEYSVLLRRGSLDVTFARITGANAQLAPILFQLMPETSLLSAGKVISEKSSMKLLPSGFQEDPAPPPGAPATPAPPPLVKPGPLPVIPTGGTSPPPGNPAAPPAAPSGAPPAVPPVSPTPAPPAATSTVISTERSAPTPAKPTPAPAVPAPVKR